MQKLLKNLNVYKGKLGMRRYKIQKYLIHVSRYNDTLRYHNAMITCQIFLTERHTKYGNANVAVKWHLHFKNSKFYANMATVCVDTLNIL